MDKTRYIIEFKVDRKIFIELLNELATLLYDDSMAVLPGSTELARLGCPTRLTIKSTGFTLFHIFHLWVCHFTYKATQIENPPDPFTPSLTALLHAPHSTAGKLFCIWGEARGEYISKQIDSLFSSQLIRLAILYFSARLLTSSRLCSVSDRLYALRIFVTSTSISSTSFTSSVRSSPLKKHTSGLPLSQMTTPKHMRSSYLLLAACILRRYKLVRVTKTLLHSTYSILEYNLEGNLVYFIDMLESGYHTGTDVNFSVRISGMGDTFKLIENSKDPGNERIRSWGEISEILSS